MRRPYLIVNDHESTNYKYRLSWYLPEDQDIGGNVGDQEFAESDLNKEGIERECVVSYLAAQKTPGATRDRDGFYWESNSKATAALRVVKAALKDDGGSPMPEWALKAIAAGWKAPKGWKP